MPGYFSTSTFEALVRTFTCISSNVFLKSNIDYILYFCFFGANYSVNFNRYTTSSGFGNIFQPHYYTEMSKVTNN